eukprot:g81494.t1
MQSEKKRRTLLSDFAGWYSNRLGLGARDDKQKPSQRENEGSMRDEHATRPSGPLEFRESEMKQKQETIKRWQEWNNDSWNNALPRTVSTTRGIAASIRTLSARGTGRKLCGASTARSRLQSAELSAELSARMTGRKLCGASMARSRLLRLIANRPISRSSHSSLSRRRK